MTIERRGNGAGEGASNNAEQQAAYRARNAHQQPVRQAVLASIGQELHGRLCMAVAEGTNHVPAAVLGKGADDTLINLMAYLTRGVLLNAPKPRRPEGEAPAENTVEKDPGTSA